MRIPAFLLILLSWKSSFSQTGTKKTDHFTIDTLHLGQFTAKKMVAYKYHSVTIFVDYKDYLASIKVFRKRYKKGMKDIKWAKAKGEYINPDYEPRWLVIDSVYNTIQEQSKVQDTIYLTQAIFDKVGLGPLMDFDIYIENGHCIIFDQKNIRQTIIIRQKCSWYRGPLEAWGGRKYFLPGSAQEFYVATDWIS